VSVVGGTASAPAFRSLAARDRFRNDGRASSGARGAIGAGSANALALAVTVLLLVVVEMVRARRRVVAS